MTYPNLREKAKVATDSEWKFSPWHIEEGSPAVRHGVLGYIIATTDIDANAAYIAAANPTAILDLLDREAALVEALRSLMDTSIAIVGSFDSGDESEEAFEMFYDARKIARRALEPTP